MIQGRVRRKEEKGRAFALLQFEGRAVALPHSTY